jgi:hypothetical protein
MKFVIHHIVCVVVVFLPIFAYTHCLLTTLVVVVSHYLARSVYDAMVIETMGFRDFLRFALCEPKLIVRVNDYCLQVCNKIWF